LVSAIECPVQVVFADPPQSYLPGPLRSERAALLAKGRVAILPGTHHLHMEKPEEVGALVGEFFR
jgi:pimeloyl-ACP methyl ester carboxylesterase